MEGAFFWAKIMRCCVCDSELNNYEVTLKYPPDHPKFDEYLDMCTDCIVVINENAVVCNELL